MRKALNSRKRRFPARAEGEAITADSTYCAMYGEESCDGDHLCEWDTPEALCVVRRPHTRVGLLEHILHGPRAAN
jgi:hypothetical protein